MKKLKLGIWNKNEPVYPKNFKQMGTERKNNPLYPNTSKQMGIARENKQQYPEIHKQLKRKAQPRLHGWLRRKKCLIIMNK